MNIDWITFGKIALYGLGTETERFIKEHGEGLNIVGLLDGYKESGQLFGLPIISLQQAINVGVDLIIVVARPGSCKVIAKRIKKTCVAHNIKVFDIRENDLLVEREPRFSFGEVIACTKSKLKNAIDENDVISFDLFDTIVARKYLSYIDIFELLGVADVRLSAEKELANKGAPTLQQLYGHVTEQIDIDKTPKQLAEMEWQLDRESFVVREGMKEILEYAKTKDKTLIITSDNYYSKQQIEDALKELDLDYFETLYLSCEYGCSKTNGLFDLVKNQYPGKRILHIGDDDWADIEKAKEVGITTFKLYSGKDLFDLLGGMGIESHIKTLSDRIKLGMFVARQFSSPFQFEDGNNKLQISAANNIGYELCAPIIMDFVLWMIDKADKEQLDDILLCARDGYLVEKIYNRLSDDGRAKYFLTSRISAIRAGISTDEDIAYVNSMKFFGDEKESLRIRFGVNSEEQILPEAKNKRENYLKYVQTLNLSNDTLGVFDFVAKGTTQLFLQKMIPNRIKGLYFLQLEPEFMADKGLDIESFYTEDERDKSVIFDNYYILETILTSPMPSVDEFDNTGQPVYGAETRTSESLVCVERIQQGILEYINDCLSLIPIKDIRINKTLDESFLSLIHKLEIVVPDFMELVIEDPFFGRMTDIKDVL